MTTINSKPVTKEYEKGWDRIFGKKDDKPVTKIMENPQEERSPEDVKCKHCSGIIKQTKEGIE